MKTFYYILCILTSVNLFAQRAGDLYTDFGNDGYYIEDTMSMAYDLGLLSDGSIIVAGTLSLTGPQYDILAIKLNEHGEIEPFGELSGRFRYDIATFDVLTSIAILPGDTILLAGFYGDDPVMLHPLIIKLLPNGELDENFADNGIFHDESVFMSVTKIAVYEQEDTYSIVLGGLNGDDAPTLMMVDHKGDVETSFGTDGLLESTTIVGQVCDLFIDSENNRLYGCGIIDGGGAFLAKCVLPDGSDDPAFGMGGVILFTPAADFSGTFNTLIVDKTEGTLVVMGSYPLPAGDKDIFAYRVDTATGNPDLSFGINGFAALRSPDSDDYIRSAKLQSDGKYYFGGSSDYYGTNDFFIGRINHNGIGDTAFGTNGLVLTDLGSNEVIFDIQLSPDEDILYATGFSGETSDPLITVAAYHTTVYTITPPVGTENRINDDLTCYPNPSAGSVMIRSCVTGPKQVQVLDITGKELYAETFNEERIDMNLGLLRPSVYLIRVTLPDEQVITYKMVKN